MIRARAGIGFTLTEAMDEGHCGLPLDELVPVAEQLLGIPSPIVEQALDLEVEAGEVVADTVGERRCIFLAGLHRAERAVADRLRALQVGALPWPHIEPAKAVPWVEARAGGRRSGSPCSRRSWSSPAPPVATREDVAAVVREQLAPVLARLEAVRHKRGAVLHRSRRS